MRPAREAEIPRLWPRVRAADLFPGSSDFTDAWRAAPWRVLVGAHDDLVVLKPWRHDSAIVQAVGLWTAFRRIGTVIDDLTSVARAQGFASLLSPVIEEEQVSAYAAAGMLARERLVSLAAPVSRVAALEMPRGVGIRLGLDSDIKAVLEIEEACFSEFWRYGERDLVDLRRGERFVVAESGGMVVGYTLSARRGQRGSLSRLGVHPRARRSGVGTALAAESVACMDRAGVPHVYVCTQEENASARALYASLGFAESQGRLILLERDVERRVSA